MDLKVFHPIRQRRLRGGSTYEQLGKKKDKESVGKKKLENIAFKSNPCAAANCSALCLLSPTAPFYKCDCPSDFYLSADQKTCTANCTAAQFLCKKSMKCIPFYW